MYNHIFNPEKVKQGIELETYIRRKENIKKSEKHLKTLHSVYVETSNFPEEIREIVPKNYLWKKPHWDTGRATEIDTTPHDNLEELKEVLNNIMNLVYDYCNRKEYFCMLLGQVPVSSHAGGHIHISVSKGYGDSKDIKDKLYPFQPFISLLGQNSSYSQVNLDGETYSYSLSARAIPIEKYVLSRRKDTRIKSYYGGFSPKNLNSGMLVRDKVILNASKGTLEVRFPSSGSLYQLIGIATFLKACIFQEGTKMQNTVNDISFLKELNCKVPLFGATTKVKLNYDKPRYITLGQLFTLVLHSEPFKYGLKEALSELDSYTARRVLEFYEIFSRNRSMTDYYNFLLKKKKGTYSQCEKLHDIQQDEFFKKLPVFERVRLKKSKSSSNTPITVLPELYNIKEEDVDKL
jgi:hypothetical protein